MKNWKLSDWMRVCVIALAVLALALTLYALYRPGPEAAAFAETEAAWNLDTTENGRN